MRVVIITLVDGRTIETDVSDAADYQEILRLRQYVWAGRSGTVAIIGRNRSINLPYVDIESVDIREVAA